MKCRCYFCDKEIKDEGLVSVRFTTKKLREVHSRGFFSLERQKDGSDKGKWNKPYTTKSLAQTAIDSFQFCDKCWIDVYDFIKKQHIKDLNKRELEKYETQNNCG